MTRVPSREVLQVGTDGSKSQVVFQLKTTAPARRATRSLAVALNEGSVSGAVAEKPLARALLGNLVQSVEPVFPSRSLRRVAVAERMIMALEQPEVADEDPVLSRINIAQCESEDRAKEACKLLCKDSTVAYAHIPQERFLLLPKKKRRRRRQSTRVDPLANRQWGLNAIELFQAQAAAGFDPATDIVITVIDSGVDASHPDLKNVIEDEQNFTTGPKKDKAGHGTHVCGIIAATTNNGIGVSGVCQSTRLMSLKALSPYNAAGYYRAIRYATDHGAQVINFSLGGGYDQTEELILRRTIRKNIIVCAAMSNESSKEKSYPAALADVISVGASTEADTQADFSNRGPHIDLVAPGVNILSTVPTYRSSLAETTDYESWPGTSMATPFVSATVALMFAKKPTATLSEIRRALQRSADKVDGQTGFTHRLGHGRLNVRKALARI